MTTKLLAEIVGIRKGIKARALTELTALHKLSQDATKYSGFRKQYTPLDESGERFPEERKIAELTAATAIAEMRRILTPLLDVIASTDAGNAQATADVVLPGGSTLLSGIHATTLLALEKELVDIRTFIDKMPALDTAEEWEVDPATGLHRTRNNQTTHRTRKEPQVVVKYPATPEHPAQTETFSVDRVVGHWTLAKQSGALSVPRKRVLLDRIDTLIQAVKQARERANATPIEPVKIGDTFLGYLFAE